MAEKKSRESKLQCHPLPLHISCSAITRQKELNKIQENKMIHNLPVLYNQLKNNIYEVLIYIYTPTPHEIYIQGKL